jgi:hypothetical protein
MVACNKPDTGCQFSIIHFEWNFRFHHHQYNTSNDNLDTWTGHPQLYQTAFAHSMQPEIQMVSISFQRLQPTDPKKIYPHRCNVVLSLQDQCCLLSNVAGSIHRNHPLQAQYHLQICIFPAFSLCCAFFISLNNFQSFRNGLFPIPYFLSKIGVGGIDLLGITHIPTANTKCLCCQIP